MVVLVIFAFCGDAAGTTIHRCVGDDGIVRFQDQPCQRGEDSRRIELLDAPPPMSLPDRHETKPGPSVEAASPLIVPAPATETDPDLHATLCTREDGSRYLSETGSGEQRAVPLGVLGIPEDSLAGAYGGRNGIGVSAPGLRAVPIDRTRGSRIGALYTWVEDPCVRIDALQLCEFLDARIADAERRLRFAFSDTRAKVGSELQSLRLRATECRR